MLEEVTNELQEEANKQISKELDIKQFVEVSPLHVTIEKIKARNKMRTFIKSNKVSHKDLKGIIRMNRDSLKDLRELVFGKPKSKKKAQ